MAESLCAPLDSGDRMRIGELLRRGGVLVFPTDTFYGIGCDAGCESAVRRIHQIKKRPEGLGLPVIAADRAQVEREVLPLPSNAEKLMERFWPGPLSLVLTLREGSTITPGARRDDSAAFRVPDLELARDLCEASNRILVATSANLSGSPPVCRARDLAPQVRDAADLVLEGVECPGGRPSTLVDLRGPTPMLLRPGAVLRAELETELEIPVQVLPPRRA